MKKKTKKSKTYTEEEFNKTFNTGVIKVSLIVENFDNNKKFSDTQLISKQENNILLVLKNVILKLGTNILVAVEQDQLEQIFKDAPCKK
jgi:hypothetical protein